MPAACRAAAEAADATDVTIKAAEAVNAAAGTELLWHILEHRLGAS